MPITYRTPTGASSNGFSTTIVEGSGNPQPGDDRFVFVNVTTTVAITPPTGWTVLYNAAVSSAKVAVLYRPNFVSGEGSHLINYDTNTYFGVSTIAVSGRNTAITPDLAVVGNAASTSMVAPTLNPSTSDGLLLVWYCPTRGSSGGNTATMSTPSGLTLLNTVLSGAIGYPQLLCGVASTSTATTPAYTSTQDTSSVYRATTLYIPASGGVALPTAPVNAVRNNARLTFW